MVIHNERWKYTMKIENSLWKVVNPLWKEENIKIKALEMKINIQKWYILPLNSSLEMLVFNLWSRKILRRVSLAGSKE